MEYEDLSGSARFGMSRRTAFGLCAIVQAFLFQPVSAAVITVGPTGDFTTLQAALDSAVATPGDDEIRVQVGTFTENISIDLLGTGDAVDVTGSWDMSFTTRAPGRLSRIDGSASGRVLYVETSGSDRFSMDGFVIENGLSGSRAGVLLSLAGSSLATLINNTIDGNVAESARADGGGLSAFLEDSSRLVIRQSDFTNNQAISTEMVDVRGAGLQVQLSGLSSFELSDNLFQNNVASIPGSGSALGAAAVISDFSELDTVANPAIVMTDNRFIDNQANAESVTGIGLFLSGNGLVLRRNQFLDNNDGGVTAFGSQAEISVFEGDALMTDSLLAGGNGRGLSVFAGTDGRLNISNLTIVGHGERGILANTGGNGILTLYNSISVNSATNAQLAPQVDSGNNIFIDDATLFVDPVGRNFQLAPGSAAVDAGTTSPPGGLGMTDLLGAARVNGPSVDIGAFEQADVLFNDRFED